MPKNVQMPDGTVVEFPAGMPDETIAKIIREQTGQPSVTDRISSGYQAIRGAVGKGLDLLDWTPGARRAAGMPPLGEQYNPLPQNLKTGVAQTAVGLVPGMGGVGGALARTGAATVGGGVGAALEGEDPIAGAYDTGLPVAVLEAAIPAGGKIIRSLPGMKARIASAYTERIGGDIEQATGGVLRGLRTPADLDAAVRGAQGAGGRLETGRKALGDFYQQRVQDATSAIGGSAVTVPTLGPNPVPLRQAVHDIQNIAGSQSATNPALRTVVGRQARELRAQAWQELEREVTRLDPSGAAVGALREGRQIFAIGANFLDAVRKSGAITRGPNEISFDTSKFQKYVSENRGKFIDSFRAAGIPEAWPRFVGIVYRGGPVGTQDVLARTGSVSEAGQQLLRSGGGAGTTAVLPARTALPGLGSEYTGRPPFSMPAGGQTLADVLGLGISERLGIPERRQ